MGTKQERGTFPMQREDIKAEIVSVIEDNIYNNYSPVTEHSRLRDDLCLGTVAISHVRFELEDRFNVYSDGYPEDEWVTVEDVIEFFRRKIQGEEIDRV